jgi:hypothetical protein
VLRGHRRRRRADRHQADRALDRPKKPVYVLGTGEAAESPIISQMADFTSSRAFRQSSRAAFDQCGLSTSDVDHLMVYDAFAHLPIYGLEDVGFVGRARPARSSPRATRGPAVRCR